MTSSALDSALEILAWAAAASEGDLRAAISDPNSLRAIVVVARTELRRRGVGAS